MKTLPPLYLCKFRLPDNTVLIWDRDQSDGKVVPIKKDDWVVFEEFNGYMVSQVILVEDDVLHCVFADEEGEVAHTIAIEKAQRLRPSSGISIGF